MTKRVFKANGKMIGFKQGSNMLVLEAMMHEGFFGAYHKIEIHMQDIKRVKEFAKEIDLNYDDEKKQHLFGKKPIKGRKIQITIR